VNHRKAILLVDDHPVVREALRDIIELTDDLRVFGEAESVAQALRKLKKSMPDAVLLDISLRKSNGFELLKEIRAGISSTLPVLMFSVLDGKKYAKLSLDAGAQGFVNKGESIHTVLKALRTVLNGGTFLSSM
jgi:DNA-binding NarL/FixJ family response regulator